MQINAKREDRILSLIENGVNKYLVAGMFHTSLNGIQEACWRAETARKDPLYAELRKMEQYPQELITRAYFSLNRAAGQKALTVSEFMEVRPRDYGKTFYRCGKKTCSVLNELRERLLPKKAEKEELL